MVNWLGADESGKLCSNSVTKRDVAQLWCNFRKRPHDEKSLVPLRMRDLKRSSSSKPAARPQDDIEIERPLSPASCTTPAEAEFYALQSSQHFERGEGAFDQCGAIGIASPRWAYGSGFDDRSGCDELEGWLGQPPQRPFQYRARRKVTRERSV